MYFLLALDRKKDDLEPNKYQHMGHVASDL